jgi:hypothetical protein
MELQDEDFDHVNPGEPRTLIPQEGQYPAQFINHDARPYGQWGEKLVFLWKVFTSTDRSHSVMVCRYYNLTRDGPECVNEFGTLAVGI